MAIARPAAWAVLGTLGVLTVIALPDLGSGAWPFAPASVDPHGALGPLVRAADREWDPDIPRTAAMIAALLVALAGAVAWRADRWRRRWAIALCAVVVLLLVVPAVLLQVGLRDATAPWYHVNDSTYQIEIAGDLVLDGDNPYGHDYRQSGLENWYPAAGEGGRQQVALDHFAYFPGTVLTAAAWRLLPAPFDDYRLLVLLATLALLPAAFLFPAPFEWRLAIGAALAANPLAIKAAWFGTADAPSVLCLVVAFALATRSRWVWAAVLLAVAVLLKQFALVALPFVAVMFVLRGGSRPTAVRAAAAFGGVLIAGALPFLIAGPGALWDDTIAYGAGTYRIVGYGLSALLVRAGVIDDRFDPYPFALLALLVWAPVTAWLLWGQLRSRALWTGAAGFSISMLVLLFLGRVFQTSYLSGRSQGLRSPACSPRAIENDRPNADARRRAPGPRARLPPRRAGSALLAAPGGRAAPACRRPSCPRTASEMRSRR